MSKFDEHADKIDWTAVDIRAERAFRSTSGRAFLERIKAPGVVGVARDLASEPGRHSRLLGIGTDYHPVDCACDLLSCAECVSRSPFHHADPDRCICSTGPGRCPAYGFGFCACVCHGAVVKENRPASVEGDRERGVEARSEPIPLPKICAPNRNL